MTEPMRVLQVLATSGGGVGRHVRAVSTGRRAAGDAVVVAGPSSTAEAFDFASAGIPFLPVEIADRPRPAADARAVAALRRACRRADVVHAHGLRAGALAVAAARLAPHRPAVVVTLHNAPVGGVRVAVVHAVLERLVARGADVVLGVSGDLVRRQQDLGARDVQRALVPAPTGPRPRTGPVATRRALAVPDGAALLVTVARLAPQKGLDLLLDAVALLGRDGLPVLAVVAGDGPLHEHLSGRLRAQALPVRLLGRREDATDLLVAADIVVVPSVWEGQPLVVQEALRVGAAVVATDVGGTGEVSGDAAVLVPAGDPPALAAAIGALVRDPGARADLAARARRRASRLPTDADAVRQLGQVYQRVVVSRRPPPSGP
jgi:glycosyltransferase involved in cell wall biosynthesis